MTHGNHKVSCCKHHDLALNSSTGVQASLSNMDVRWLDASQLHGLLLCLPVDSELRQLDLYLKVHGNVIEFAVLSSIPPLTS